MWQHTLRSPFSYRTIRIFSSGLGTSSRCQGVWNRLSHEPLENQLPNRFDVRNTQPIFESYYAFRVFIEILGLSHL
jgi:hypothetical protein